MDSNDILAIARQDREQQQRHRNRCALKRVFRSEDTVARTARELTEKYGEQMYYYQCPVCSQFHLTTKPPETVM